MDIVRFIEARPQFHDRRDLFAVFHRVHQRANDPRIAAGAIKRLLDREHVRVLRGLFEKIDDAAETFVGMMQQDVALANGGEQIGLAAQRRRHRRDERRVAQFRRMIALVNRHQPRRIQRAIDDIQDRLLSSRRVFEKRVADFRRAIAFHFQPDGVAFAAVVQFVFDGFEQIRRFLFVDVKLAVARDAKLPVAQEFSCRETDPRDDGR